MYDYTKRTRLLFRSTFDFALSTWKTIRVQRMRDLARPAIGRIPRRTEREWSLSEGRALYSAANAALNAGNPLLSAGLAHLLLRAAPEELRDHPFFREKADATASLIRQAAYEVDERFPLACGEPAGKQLIRQRRTAIHPWQLWIEHDIRTSWRWRVILRAYPKWSVVFPQLYDGETPSSDPTQYDSKFLLGSIVFGSALPSFPAPEVLPPTFELCLRYGFLSWAGRLLVRMHASSDDLINFAHAVKRSLQIMPYGWDLEEQDKRRRLLRDAWLRWKVDRKRRRMLQWKALGMHEVLLGRALSILRHSGSGDTQLLIEKLSGLTSAATVRRTFRTRRRVDQRGLGTVDKRSFDRFLDDVRQRSSLGQPVCVSIASTGDDEWSILAAGGSGRWSHRFQRLPRLGATAAKLRRSAHRWFQQDDRNTTCPIPWGREYLALADVVAEISREVMPKSRWLMLAVEPELAGLPWQNLLPVAWPEPMIVSVVPSFSWAARAYDRFAIHPPGPKLVLAADDELVASDASWADKRSFLDLKRLIERNEAAMRRRIPSIAIALGHGRWDPAAKTALVAVNGKPIPCASRTEENWLDLGRYRVLVTHSCHAGAVRAHYLGDMGGLPGITLGMKCRLHCAPVTEVPPDVAFTLQHHLIEDTILSTFAERYLAAIRRDRRVSLYNIYGFPDEAV
jgi:hypothetical protein